MATGGRPLVSISQVHSDTNNPDGKTPPDDSLFELDSSSECTDESPGSMKHTEIYGDDEGGIVEESTARRDLIASLEEAVHLPQNNLQRPTRKAPPVPPVTAETKLPAKGGGQKVQRLVDASLSTGSDDRSLSESPSVFIGRTSVSPLTIRGLRTGEKERFSQVLCKLGSRETHADEVDEGSDTPQGEHVKALERIQGILAEREEDLRLAAEIGQTLLSRYSEVSEDNEMLRAEVEKCDSMIDQLQAKVEELESSNSMSQHKNDRLLRRLRDTEALVDNLTDDITAVENKMGLQSATDSQAFSKLNKMYEESQRREEELQNSLDQARGAEKELMRAIKMLEVQLNKLADERGLSDSVLEEKHAEVSQLQKEMQDLSLTKHSAENLKMQLENLRSENEELTKKVAGLEHVEEKVSALNVQNEDLKLQLEEERSLREEMRQALREVEENHLDLQLELRSPQASNDKSIQHELDQSVESLKLSDVISPIAKEGPQTPSMDTTNYPVPESPAHQKSLTSVAPPPNSSAVVVPNAIRGLFYARIIEMRVRLASQKCQAGSGYTKGHIISMRSKTLYEKAMALSVPYEQWDAWIEQELIKS